MGCDLLRMLIYIVCNGAVLRIVVGDIRVTVGRFYKMIADVCSLIIDCI